ncbi:nitroreductase family protein [Maledivibacter halophilus]|uniref:Nitroreductase n=1 Tax=Maledivibacter halophilus TaxID=36842 RepID=A0A1T5KGH7_9FIRM|nr:nitroreductase family protein [Maledivibacter halophilus]SKC62797.1 Nitroreductase [Maledivibacter halophilus]
MELLEVMRKRRSVRKFKDMDIDNSIITDILESAKLAPETDTCNYYFGVIEDKKVKNEISSATLWAQWVSKAPVIIACCCDISWDIGEQNDDDYGVIGNKLRYGEDIVNFLRKHENRKACKTLVQSTPVYIAAQHIILTAVSHNLRGCLVDFIDIEKINKILGLPEHITCQLLVPIGYADETPEQKRGKNRNDMIFYDKWE